MLWDTEWVHSPFYFHIGVGGDGLTLSVGGGRGLEKEVADYGLYGYVWWRLRNSLFLSCQRVNSLSKPHFIQQKVWISFSRAGFNKRLIDDLLDDSLKAMGQTPCVDQSLSTVERLKTNIQLLLNGTVPEDQMAKFRQENKSTEELLVLLTDEKKK